ncbi:thiamine pyrophosphate-binding protein [Breoghania sp. L-A4]|uniref:thiamine pyrophosphate-binding protein n=1 Tax=Breoghania sp. L-A4 TaxID=2304600 RepID=UPI000E35A484|nr:thiamine pyrophosphate-binding protein [Breoghania sp. L-A4]AXS39351.1 thiamine pyrophosphate-binding protein [Breoghania sp. L-A4]
MTGADIIAASLKVAGCSTAFGIPGGEVLALVDAMSLAGIRFVLTKHENAAGFMAEGAWHAEATDSNDAAPGILVATLGPGMANAVNVVANAHQERVPMIFLTGCVDEAEAETYTHQVFDHQAVLRPIVKASFRASAGALAPMMQKALALACEGQPGPVHIDLPISVAEGRTTEVPPARIAPPPSLRDTPAAGLDETRALLAAANRPLVIAGVDALNEGAGDAIAEFCKAAGAPLITTYKAKGLMDESHALALGGAGLSPKADRILLPLVEASDFILLAGYDPIEMRTGWRNPWSVETNVVEIASVPRTHGMHTVSHTLTGGVAPTLKALAQGIASRPGWSDGEPGRARTDLENAFAAEDAGWGPATVFHALREALPKTTVATADSGAHRILLSQIWRVAKPRQLLQSAALCTMGCAVPLAAGYKYKRPDTPVVAFVGDAGLEMGLGELATLRDLNLPVIIVVLVDASLALIELKQRSSQRANAGVDFGESDFPAIAKALGGHGVWIGDTDTLRREADAALARDSFTVLACRIGRKAYDGTF